MEEVITLADKGKFSKFADKVKGKLEDKLRTHKTIVKNAEKLNKFDAVKDKFAEIDKMMSKEEPVSKEVKTEPKDAAPAAEETK